MTSVFAAARTPICPVDGELSRLHPVDMAAAVLRELVARGPVDVEEIDEVWAGCCEPVGAQGADMARAAILSADWPVRITGIVVDAAEISGTAALHAAAAAIRAGTVEFAVVLGVSSSSIVPPGASALGRTYGRPWSDGPAKRFEAKGGMLSPHRAADAVAAALGIGRDQQDLAVSRSLEQRSTAHPPYLFDPYLGDARGGRAAADVLRDTPDDLTHLPPAFDLDGAVTAASFAPAADGVSGLILGRSTSAGADRPVLGRVMAVGRSADDPNSPSAGARTAVDSALGRVDLTRADVKRWEIVESSAAALLSICRELELDPAMVNPYGGALATGDSGASEEIRLVVDSLGSGSAVGPVVALASGPTGAAATVFEGSLHEVDPSADS